MCTSILEVIDNVLNLNAIIFYVHNSNDMNEEREKERVEKKTRKKFNWKWYACMMYCGQNVHTFQTRIQFTESEQTIEKKMAARKLIRHFVKVSWHFALESVAQILKQMEYVYKNNDKNVEKIGSQINELNK